VTPSKAFGIRGMKRRDPYFGQVADERQQPQVLATLHAGANDGGDRRILPHELGRQSEKGLAASASLPRLGLTISPHTRRLPRCGICVVDSRSGAPAVSAPLFSKLFEFSPSLQAACITAQEATITGEQEN